MQKLLTIQQAADALGVSYSTMNRWRAHGIGPTYVMIGAKPRYRLEDLEAYANQQKVVPGA